MSHSALINPRFATITGIILVAAVFRLLPHWPNVTPVAAMALFGGAYFSRKIFAFILPMAALFLSDLVLGFHGTMWAVYLGFAITVAFGLLIRSKVSVWSVAGVVLGSSVIFFLLTNFASWMGSAFYAPTFTGLLTAYTAGLPFFLNSLLGDVFFAGVLFGSFQLLQQWYPALKPTATSF
jgi:hypothetical protein